MVITRYSRNGKRYHLVKDSDLKSYIAEITAIMAKVGSFYNVHTEPYTGKKYGTGYTWVVIG